MLWLLRLINSWIHDSLENSLTTFDNYAFIYFFVSLTSALTKIMLKADLKAYLKYGHNNQ